YRHAREIEHEIEALGAAGFAALEVDRADGPTCRNAGPVRLAAIEVDLVAPVDRLLRAGANACVAARAQIEVDRILLRPFDAEGAEPAAQPRHFARVHRELSLGGQFGSRRAAGGQYRDRKLFAEHTGPVQRGGGGTDDQ